MGILDAAANPQVARHGTAPRDDRRELRRGMRGDAVRLHGAGDLHGGVRRIGEHAQGIGSNPALDETVVLDALRLLSEERR